MMKKLVIAGVILLLLASVALPVSAAQNGEKQYRNGYDGVCPNPECLGEDCPNPECPYPDCPEYQYDGEKEPGMHKYKKGTL